jgi:hypothetical protein
MSSTIIANSSGIVETADGSNVLELGTGIDSGIIIDSGNSITMPYNLTVKGTINGGGTGNYKAVQEIQIATAGQTVFTLNTFTYVVGSNTLSVYVDGVNQVGSSSSYAYVETSPSVITFTQPIHVGAVVKFTTTLQLASSGGGGGAGGSNYQLQYNDAGNFGGLAYGTQGQVLVTQGSIGIPIWMTAPWLTGNQIFTGANTFTQYVVCTSGSGYSALQTNSVTMGNATTGFYYNGTDAIGLQVNNTPVFAFFQNGNFLWNGDSIPAPSGNTTQFLRNDGTWAVPGGSGGGDVFLANDQTFTGLNTFDQYVVCNSGSGYSALQTNSVTVGNAQTGMNFAGGQLNWQINNTPYLALQTGGLVPSTDNTLSLGNASLRYTSLGLSSGNFYWNNYTISAPSGNTALFLRNDGNWASPGGGASLTADQTFTGNNTFTQPVVATVSSGYSALGPNSIELGNATTGIYYNGSNSLGITINGVGTGFAFNQAGSFGWGTYSISAPPGGTTNFLRADGTWSSPPGGASLSANQTFTGSNTFSQVLNCSASGGYSALGQNSVLLGNATTGLYYNNSDAIGLQVNNTSVFAFFQNGNFLWNGTTIAPPSGNTGLFLRNDGSWASPPGGASLTANQTFTGNNTFTGVITSQSYNLATNVAMYYSGGSVVISNNGSNFIFDNSNNFTSQIITSTTSTTAPTYYFPSSGGSKYYWDSANNRMAWQVGTALVMVLDGGGNLTLVGGGANGWKPGGGPWSDSSDERLKTNIVPLTGALEYLNQFNPVSYDWKFSRPGVCSVGFIAQEVEKIAPHAVAEYKPSDDELEFIPEGMAKGIGWQNDMTAYLIGAIQELQAKLKAAGVEGF